MEVVNLGFVDHFKSGKDKYNVEILIYRCENSRRFQFVANIVQEGMPPSSKVIHFDVVLAVDVEKRDELGFTVDVDVDFRLGHFQSTFEFGRFTHEHARALQFALMDFARTHM